MNVLTTYKEFDSNNFDLNVDHYGAEVCDSNYCFGPTIRDNYVLHFIVNGKGQFTINGQTTTLKEGDFFILPKNQVTFYQADETEPWSYLWVGFGGSRAESILHQTSLLDHYYCHSSLSSKILDQMMTLLQFSNQEMNAVNELRLVGELYKLLAFLMEEFPTTNDTTTLTKNYIKQTLKMIHTQYDSPLKVNDIAQKLNLNRSYLYKIFKEQVGCSIKEYLLQVKMEKSADLILNPNLSISEVSNSVGFQDPLVFSKTFKKHFQLSPSYYRKRHMKSTSKSAVIHPTPNS